MRRNPEFFQKKKTQVAGFLSLQGNRQTEADKLNLVAHVAQLAEHVLGKDEVIGSIPIMGSRRF